MNTFKKLSVGAVLFAFSMVLMPSLAHAEETTNCLEPNVLLCSNFRGITLFKDQTPLAKFFRYANGGNDPFVALYQNNFPGLRLKITVLSQSDNYSNANISTSEINNGASPFLRFGVNTKAEARIKFDPKMNASAANPGTTKGSAGFLFWDYFKNPTDPETGTITNARDVIGFSWQDSASTLPGFKALGAIDGNFALFQPLESVNISEYNTYAIERRHTSLKYFVNGNLVAELPVNQPGTLVLPDEQGFAADTWVDNASYQYEIGTTLTGHLTFNHLPEPTEINVGYIKVSSIE